ncbi:MAG: hypothetical protein AAGE84_04465 [Cyanobacteria bacterium P01_G01_bin.39]
MVHNKEGGGGGGGYGRVGSSHYPPVITEKNFLGFLQASAILILGLSGVIFWRQIYNFIIYIATYKNFIEDSKLIEFTQNINPLFKNKYSIWYSRDDQIWEQVPSRPEVRELEYQDFISKTELLDKVETLFIQYQNDWTHKDFQSMRQYVLEPFYTKQKAIFQRNFGVNFDIVHNCSLSQIVPLEVELEQDKCFIRLQINGEMINFKLSPEGYVLSGKSEPRLFTEYWDIQLTSDKKCYLANINQTLINYS